MLKKLNQFFINHVLLIYFSAVVAGLLAIFTGNTILFYSALIGILFIAIGGIIIGILETLGKL